MTGGGPAVATPAGPGRSRASRPPRQVLDMCCWCDDDSKVVTSQHCPSVDGAITDVRVKVWDSVTGALLRSFTDHTDQVSLLACGANGVVIIVLSSDCCPGGALGVVHRAAPAAPRGRPDRWSRRQHHYPRREARYAVSIIGCVGCVREHCPMCCDAVVRCRTAPLLDRKANIDQQ